MTCQECREWRVLTYESLDGPPMKGECQIDKAITKAQGECLKGSPE